MNFDDVATAVEGAAQSEVDSLTYMEDAAQSEVESLAYVEVNNMHGTFGASDMENVTDSMQLACD